MYSARIAAYICPLAMFAACATTPRVEHSPAGIAVDPEVLAAAKEVHFDYMKQLARAERGDVHALGALIELSARIGHSAAGSEQHGDILLAGSASRGRHRVHSGDTSRVSRSSGRRHARS